MHFVHGSQGGELSVRSTRLDGYPPLPTWNGTVDAPSEGTRGLCSVLSASGELVVLQAIDRGGGSAEGDDAAGSERLTRRHALRIVKVLPPPSDTTSSFCQCWSRDGQLVATAHGRHVLVYDTPGFRIRTKLHLRYSVGSMDLTQTRVNAGSGSGDIECLLMVGTSFGAFLYKFPLHQDHDNAEEAVNLPHDGTEELIAHPIAHVQDGVAICHVKFSPDGQTAAVGTVDGRLFLREFKDDSALATFGTGVLSRVLAAPRITSMSFSPCSARLVVATRKGNVYVFTCASSGTWQSMASCRELNANPKAKAGGAVGNGSAATAIQTLVSCWGSVFVVCSRATTSRLEMYDFASGKLLHSLQFTDAAAVSSSGLSQWVDQQLVTGMCCWRLPDGHTKMLCHDTNATLQGATMPRVPAEIADPVAREGGDLLGKRRQWAVGGLTSCRLSSRALLCACSVGLASLGVLPLVEVGYVVRQSADASSPAAADKMKALLALTAYDKSAVGLSGLLAALGAALLVLNLAEVPLASALRAAKLLGVGVGAAVLVVGVLLSSIASHRIPDTPWRAEIFEGHEGLFERQVNDLFCHTKGVQVCDLGSVADARQLFPLQDWPVGSDRVPGKRITIACEGFKDSVQLWGYQSKMELCRLCNTVSREERAQQEQLGAEHGAELLAAVKQLSFGELQWCGEYLSNRRPDYDVGHSPYWKHRREFQALLQYDTSPCSLQSVVRVLELLELVASICCLALLRWVWALRTLLLAARSGEGDKADSF
ncbi:hypothetical protein BBJ28_00014181 [Nothophytophthora sp. Chile5]|nr:hypothetical protein BBJ28_00014181 [Nothophytophthora sp. Chile5]